MSESSIDQLATLTARPGPGVVAGKALTKLAGELAAQGCPYLPAVNRKRHELYLYEPEDSRTASPAMVIAFRDGRYIWGDPERAYSENEVEEAAKEIAYFLASEGS
jgi:hypothetical protein